MIKSSRDRAPRVGDMFSHSPTGERFRITSTDNKKYGGALDLVDSDGDYRWCPRSTWDNGGCLVHEEGPLPNAAPDAPVAKPASGEGRRLADGREDYPAAPFWCSVDRIGETGHTYSDKVNARYYRTIHGQQVSACAACEACAEAAGVFADSKPVANPVHTPGDGAIVVTEYGAAPPACTWACTPRDNVHGPRCRKFVAPAVSASMKSELAAIKKQRSIVGEYQSGGDGLRLSLGGADPQDFHRWSALQHGLAPDSPQPMAPRIRDVYRTDNWRDPDWLPNRETP